MKYTKYMIKALIPQSMIEISEAFTINDLFASEYQKDVLGLSDDDFEALLSESSRLYLRHNLESAYPNENVEPLIKNAVSLYEIIDRKNYNITAIIFHSFETVEFELDHDEAIGDEAIEDEAMDYAYKHLLDNLNYESSFTKGKVAKLAIGVVRYKLNKIEDGENHE